LALDSNRLRNNIIGDLFPNFEELTGSQQDQITEAWTAICARIIEEIKLGEISAALQSGNITGINNPMTNDVTGTVTNLVVAGSLE
jgi:hypothetical protein